MAFNTQWRTCDSVLLLLLGRFFAQRQFNFAITFVKLNQFEQNLRYLMEHFILSKNVLHLVTKISMKILYLIHSVGGP